MTDTLERREAIEAWRRREVQMIGAAISTRDWHGVENAYNQLRDKIDAALATTPAPREKQEADLVRLVEEMLDNLKHCSLNSGCCHCGDSMDKHADPMCCGHTPVDMGWTASENWIAKAEATLATFNRLSKETPDAQ